MFLCSVAAAVPPSRPRAALRVVRPAGSRVAGGDRRSRREAPLRRPVSPRDAQVAETVATPGLAQPAISSRRCRRCPAPAVLPSGASPHSSPAAGPDASSAGHSPARSAQAGTEGDPPGHAGITDPTADQPGSGATCAPRAPCSPRPPPPDRSRGTAPPSRRRPAAPAPLDGPATHPIDRAAHRAS